MADAADEVARASSALTRSDLLRRGTVAAFTVSMFGGLTDRALGVYGPLKFAKKEPFGMRYMLRRHRDPEVERRRRQLLASVGLFFAAVIAGSASLWR